jgi:hypothetical protein
VWSWTELERVGVLDFRWDVHNERLTRQAGQNWINNGNELATLVPYVIILVEYNVLINPTNAGFGSIDGVPPKPFRGIAG